MPASRRVDDRQMPTSKMSRTRGNVDGVRERVRRVTCPRSDGRSSPGPVSPLTIGTDNGLSSRNMTTRKTVPHRGSVTNGLQTRTGGAGTAGAVELGFLEDRPPPWHDPAGLEATDRGFLEIGRGVHPSSTARGRRLSPAANASSRIGSTSTGILWTRGSVPDRLRVLSTTLRGPLGSESRVVKIR